MSEQNTAFEKWYEIHGNGSSYYRDRLVWNAATAEANKRIAELESEIVELKEINMELQFQNNLFMKNEIELQAKNRELSVSNNDLREKLETALTRLRKYENGI